jgi:hypothetical protein
MESGANVSLGDFGGKSMELNCAFVQKRFTCPWNAK